MSTLSGQKLKLADLDPTRCVINAVDSQVIEFKPAHEYAANPNQSPPTDSIARRMSGVPVVLYNFMPYGTSLLGDLAGSAILMTQEATVDRSENSCDPDAFGDCDGVSNLERNLIRFRAEMRTKIRVTRPFGFVPVDLGTRTQPTSRPGDHCSLAPLGLRPSAAVRAGSDWPLTVPTIDPTALPGRADRELRSDRT